MPESVDMRGAGAAGALEDAAGGASARLQDAARRFAERPRAGRPLRRGPLHPGSDGGLMSAAHRNLLNWKAQRGAIAARVVRSPELMLLFWVFVALLVFEGALRKWFLPGLAGPLLIARDPVVLLMYILAFKKKLFPVAPLPLAQQILGGIALCGALFADQFVPLVAAYGWRSNFFFLPFIFLLPRFMDRDDVVKLGRWWLIASIPMAFLLVAQFRASPDAWINISVGGAEAFTTMYGRVRTSGTFSFINGAVSFIGFSTVFLCYGLLRPKTYPAWLLVSAGLATAVSLAVSGSRSAILVASQTILGVLLVGLYERQHLGAAVRMTLALAVLGFIGSQLDVTREGIEVHVARFQVAAEQENVVTRLIDQFIVPYWMIENTPLFGYGLGMGTNVGSAYTTGNLGFLLAENDWTRIVLESGIFIGGAYLIMRVLLFVFLVLKARQALFQGESLPSILIASSCLTILAGQMGQPTGLGFIVLLAGLALAACNPPAKGDPRPAAVRQPFTPRDNAPTPRGGPRVPPRWRSAPPIPG